MSYISYRVTIHFLNYRVLIFGYNFKLFFQKFKNSIKPILFECKICGEHNCEHYDDSISTTGEVARELSPMLTSLGSPLSLSPVTPTATNPT